MTGFDIKNVMMKAYGFERHTDLYDEKELDVEERMPRLQRYLMALLTVMKGGM